MEQMTVDVALQNDVAATRWPLDEELLTPKQVAVLFRVDPRTVVRWAKAGKIGFMTTLGGHRRYRSAEVHSLLRARGNSRPS
ncbi:BldC family transcriptional regulator [Rhodococcus sp. OK302]|uniref:BldC family transcriptional regulator n=1 Tax=Rhodococcus sp. OK302 TaxID=1882769 RepID=UPI003F939814